VAKIVITSADNEEHLEFSQPITIKYMGNVLIHTENYYTPQATPNNSPRVSMEDNNPFVERLAPKRVRIKSEPIMVPGRYHSMSEIEQSFLKDILKEQADINQKQLVSRI
jgi:hypothetical protein